LPPIDFAIGVAVGRSIYFAVSLRLANFQLMDSGQAPLKYPGAHPDPLTEPTRWSGYVSIDQILASRRAGFTAIVVRAPASQSACVATSGLYALEPLNFAIPLLGVVDDFIILPLLLRRLVKSLPADIHSDFKRTRITVV
jgi:hypothetical protein